MTSHPFVTPLVELLHKNDPPRLWSVIVSAFGELVIPHHHLIRLNTLQQLTCYMGFESGALRTAISRLCKEDWLTRHKKGRNTSYGLSEKLKNIVDEASLRIYGDNFLPEPKQWQVIIFPTPQKELPSEGFALSSQVWLVPNTENSFVAHVPEAVHIRGLLEPNTPDWAVRQIIHPQTGEEYQSLLNAITPMANAGNSVHDLEPIDTMVARILLIHFWRRIVLKHQPLYHSLVPSGWVGVECSKVLPPLYHSLLEKSEIWWQENTASLPYTDHHIRQEILAQRF